MENEAPKRRGRPRKNVLPDDLMVEAARPVSPDRPPLRDALRDEDPRAALARRVAEIESVIGDADFDSADEFAIDKRTIPDGWDYEWKTFRVLGQEDHTGLNQLKKTGWEFVPASRHPNLMPKGNHEVIERKGMVLMERPAVITERFREKDRRNARNSIQIREQQLSSAPDGQFDRNHSQVKPKINRGYEPMPVPKDA